MSIYYHLNEQIEDFEELVNFIKITLKKAGKELDDESEEYEKLEEFQEQSAELLENEDYNQIINELFELRNTFQNSKISSQLIGVCTFFIQSIKDSGKRKEAQDIFVNLVKNLENTTSNQKIAQLGVLFNSLNRYPQDQYKLFGELLNYSAQEGKISMLVKSFENIDTLNRNWNLPTAELRKLYRLIVEKISGSQLLTNLKLEFIIKDISSYGKNEINDNEIKHIQQDIVTLLSQENIQIVPASILETQAVKYLTEKKHDIATALHFFISGSLNDYLKFKSANPNAIKNLGLEVEQFEKFVRVKSITQFAETGDVIKFEDFAKKLQVPVEDVEEWIILAIQYNQIEAQIDQYNDTINILANQNKHFQTEDWKDLNNQLTKTIDNLSNLLEKL